ncbi:hypothetical protein UA38_20870 [Photobacterium kishitanii]|uniref:Uncharacterized protein n=1 Tax=Photobacterium kishitanii TaxID=318456 RepID=A0A2T3KBA4_9GAMM|nr:hypothetical protein [Photobacterium kishitanii]KJG55220.1 hypothetical protein UA38_20870 [Photobacterium kishitanii]KJG58397.1 hypothetical protein UA42_19720 [Photobacterium kishitanii]KJG63840.1 hypothetical protein UA40_19730 [Photobacterium kishitanii]KJG67328.1 hypothetical protein UA41_19305 [Photobacterium kishitanii]OBU30652.1 hypothetical protein AYY23_04605 [Photobacterium kishitanii]
MSDHDQEISTWRQQRKKGLFRFIVSRSLPAFLGVLIGKIIGAVLFTDNGFNDVLVKEIIIGFIALVIAFPLLSIIHWRWKERKLRRHDEKYNPKSLENNND